MKKTTFQKITKTILSIFAFPAVLVYFGFTSFMEIFNAGRAFDRIFSTRRDLNASHLELILSSIIKENRYQPILLFVFSILILLFVAGRLQDKEKRKWLDFNIVFVSTIFSPFLLFVLYVLLALINIPINSNI